MTNLPPKHRWGSARSLREICRRIGLKFVKTKKVPREKPRMKTDAE